MAKKKKKATKKLAAKAAKKTAVARPGAKKSAAKKSAGQAKIKKATAAAAPSKKKAAAKTAAPAKKTSATLGRPLVTSEEKLYLLFKEDYHARQVFDYLRVETVKELEQFTPQEIVHILAKPIRQTVDSIRRRLAEKNRCLAGDEEFVLKHRE